MRLKRINSVMFDEFTHSYICGNKLLTGVTSLMRKHGLSPDYSGIPTSVLESAAAKGTAIHQLLEDYDNGKTVAVDENLSAYAALKLDVHCSEYLVSDEDMVASFIDKVFTDCSLADVKTTSEVHKRSVAWQLSIYAYLFEKQNPSKKVPHIYCIHVRDGKAKLIELARIPDEQVEALFQAEREGRIYEDPYVDPDVSVVLKNEDLCALVESLDIIAVYKAKLEEEEKRCSAIKNALYEYMCENKLDNMSCTYGKFSLKSGSTRTSIDSEKLKKEQPEIYAQYSKTTNVKGSVVFKPNK